jgi:genome maintenance exonuclease 1
MFNHNPPVLLKELESQTLPSGERYYTTPDGIRLPSVTTVLGARPKPQLEKWKKRVGIEEANRIVKVSSGRGKSLHSIAESYLKNDLDYFKDCRPDGKEMFLDLRPLIDKHVTDVWYQEETVYSEKIGLAGRMDLCALWDGEPAIIDFKNARKTRKKEYILDYFIQCTAYSLMLTDLIDIPIKQIVILMAVENEKPQIFIEKPRKYIQDLVKAIQYYRNNACQVA